MPSDERSAAKYSASLLAGLVTMIGFVARKSPHKLRGVAAGVTGPARERLVEVDVEHDMAEIEQQCVGSTGGEQGQLHRGGVRKTGEGSNGVAMPVLTQLAGAIWT
jgi:hypothetical protein